MASAAGDGAAVEDNGGEGGGEGYSPGVSVPGVPSQLQLRKLAAIQSFIQQQEDQEEEEEEGGVASPPRAVSPLRGAASGEFGRDPVCLAGQVDAVRLTSLERGVAAAYEAHVRAALDGNRGPTDAAIRTELLACAARARHMLASRAREREHQLAKIIRDSESLIDIMNDFIAGEERAGARLAREHETALCAAMDSAGNRVAEHIEQRIRRRVTARSARARSLAVMRRRVEGDALLARDDFDTVRESLALARAHV